MGRFCLIVVSLLMCILAKAQDRNTIPAFVSDDDDAIIEYVKGSGEPTCIHNVDGKPPNAEFLRL